MAVSNTPECNLYTMIHYRIYGASTLCSAGSRRPAFTQSYFTVLTNIYEFYSGNRAESKAGHHGERRKRENDKDDNTAIAL